MVGLRLVERGGRPSQGVELGASGVEVIDTSDAVRVGDGWRGTFSGRGLLLEISTPARRMCV